MTRTCMSITNLSTTDMPTMAEIVEATKHIQSKVEAARQRMEICVLAMEPCGACGHKARYINPPQERIQFCPCRVDELRRQLASVPSYLPEHISPFPQFMGIEIETVSHP